MMNKLTSLLLETFFGLKYLSGANLMVRLFLLVFLIMGCATTQIEKPELVDPPQKIVKEIVKKIELKFPCLDQDVWVYFKHSDVWSQSCIVIVHVPKHSLAGDEENCPAQNTKVVGYGRLGKTKLFGTHVVTMRKGLLNDPKYYTTTPPKKLKFIPDNVNSWQAKMEKEK